MRRIAMGAMALAGLSAFAQADHAHSVDECISTITAAKDYFTPEAGYVTMTQGVGRQAWLARSIDRSIDRLAAWAGG